MRERNWTSHIPVPAMGLALAGRGEGGASRAQVLAGRGAWHRQGGAGGTSTGAAGTFTYTCTSEESSPQSAIETPQTAIETPQTVLMKELLSIPMQTHSDLAHTLAYSSKVALSCG